MSVDGGKRVAWSQEVQEEERQTPREAGNYVPTSTVVSQCDGVVSLAAEKERHGGKGGNPSLRSAAKRAPFGLGQTLEV